MATAAAVTPEVSIIVPARNEEVCLEDCLASLVAQTGVPFEIIVVDDQSTDRTRAIAESFAGVRVISPPPLPAGWTGKNNAVAAGVIEARGEWLLFTDADTVHLPGSLGRALAEAITNRAELLSYSPEQVVGTFAEKVVMPVIFAELASQYPPGKVCDQTSGVVAANGQYILCRRDAYKAVGGHGRIADQILEDVALARAFRAAGYKVYFRYGADIVRTRMYRSWSELREGWTKNLALLFPHPARRAVRICVWWAVALLTMPVLIALIALYLRVRRANFARGVTLLATVVGAPVFGYLTIRSVRAHARGKVSWKGRLYSERGSSPVRSRGTPVEARCNLR